VSTNKNEANSSNILFNKIIEIQIKRLFMCAGPAKAAEHLLLPALFFGSFFCASKRKNIMHLLEHRAKA